MLALFFSCAAMPAQETATPVEPVEPVEPAYPTLPIFSLRATDVSLMKLVGASTSAIDRSCTLVVADTLDVHFKLNGFSYNRGLGDPFPAGESHILLRLYEVLDKGDSLIARLPFRVDGSTMRTYISEDYERQDSVILSIPPGEYLLEYDLTFRRLMTTKRTNPVQSPPVRRTPRPSHAARRCLCHLNAFHS